MIETIRQRVLQYKPNDLPDASSEAAVLIPITVSDSPHVILTKRSELLASHRGEVAFPGGKKDVTDNDLIATALRESEEEIALFANQVEVLGPLGSIVTRYGMRVTPFVGLVADDDLQLTPNPDEIDAIFTVPLDFFADKKNLQLDYYHYQGRDRYVPRFHYDGFKIWGVTGVMLIEMVNVIFDTNIDTDNLL